MKYPCNYTHIFTFAEVRCDAMKYPCKYVDNKYKFTYPWAEEKCAIINPCEYVNNKKYPWAKEKCDEKSKH